MRSAALVALLAAACQPALPTRYTGRVSCSAVADSMAARKGVADPARRAYSAHVGADTSAAASTVLRACSLREWVDMAFAAGYSIDVLESLPSLAFPGHPEPPTGEWRHDAWGTAWRYRAADHVGPYAITSAGPDQMFGTSDDIIVLR